MVPKSLVRPHKPGLLRCSDRQRLAATWQCVWTYRRPLCVDSMPAIDNRTLSLAFKSLILTSGRLVSGMGLAETMHEQSLSAEKSNMREV